MRSVGNMAPTQALATADRTHRTSDPDHIYRPLILTQSA